MAITAKLCLAVIALLSALIVQSCPIHDQISNSLRRKEVPTPEPFVDLAEGEGEGLGDESVDEEAAAAVVPVLSGKVWKPIKDYPLSITEAQGGTITMNGGSFLIVTGGYIENTNLMVTNRTYTFKLFDGKNGSNWVRRADLPLPLTHAAQVVVGARMFLCGGYLGQHPGPSVSNCFVYILKQDKWRELPSLPHQSAGGGMVYIKSKHSLFFAGGTHRLKGSMRATDHNDSYILDLKNEGAGWKRRAGFQNPRNHLSAVEVDKRYFFVGGQHGSNEHTGNQATMNEYDARKDKWYKRARLPFGLSHLSASTPKWGGGFLVIGGLKNQQVKSDDILFYDMLNNSWVNVGKYAREAQTPVCGQTKNTIYCSGGNNNMGGWSDGYMRGVEHKDFTTDKKKMLRARWNDIVLEEQQQ